MKKIILFLSTITAITYLAISCKSRAINVSVNETITQDSLIKKGEYLVGIMGCHDCHTPKKMTAHGPAPDMEMSLSGHPANFPLAPFDTMTTKNWALFNMTGTAMVGPWGVSYSANLTSDDTGIGTWSETQFVKALKEGKLKGLDGSRTLLPPMPWENYKEIKDEDVKAIFAYLKSTRPVSNIVPGPIPPNELAGNSK